MGNSMEKNVTPFLSHSLRLGKTKKWTDLYKYFTDLDLPNEQNRDSNLFIFLIFFKASAEYNTWRKRKQ